MDRRNFLKAALATGTLTGLRAAQAQTSTTADQAGTVNPRYSMIDSHLHYLDFLQNTDGLVKLTQAMDSAGVSQSVLFGMPMVKKWDEDAPVKPSYYLSNDSRCYHYSATDYIFLKHLEEAPAEVKARFLPFICGVNVNDMMAETYLRRLLEEFPGTVKGLGEIMSRHDDLTALTYGEPPRADHPALMNIYKLGAEKHLPILIHHNIAPSYMDKPLYLPEMERALEANRKADIIWAHVGISRRVELSNLPEIADTVLKHHKNLFFDISWLVFENYIAKDDRSLDLWAKLIERHENRFMIGTDVVGHWKDYKPNITKYYALLDRMKSSAVAKICRDNISELCRL